MQKRASKPPPPETPIGTIISVPIPNSPSEENQTIKMEPSWPTENALPEKNVRPIPNAQKGTRESPSLSELRAIALIVSPIHTFIIYILKGANRHKAGAPPRIANRFPRGKYPAATGKYR